MKYTFVDRGVTVDYIEIDPSPSVKANAQGSEIRKTYVCAWASRDDLVRELYGRKMSYDSGGIEVTQPHSISIADGNETTYHWCINVDYKPFDESKGGTPEPSARERIPTGQGVATYDYAEVAVIYDDGPWFMDESLDLGGEVIGIQGGKDVQLYWRSDHALVDKQTVRPLFIAPTGVYRVTFHALRYIPDIVFTKRGHINSVEVKAVRMRTITSQGSIVRKSFAAGTLLYNGAKLEEAYLPVGRKAKPITDFPYVRVELEFVVDEHGFNSFFRPGIGASGTWDEFDLDVGGASPYNPYPTHDLRELIGADA